MIRGDIIKETQYAQIFNCITYKIFRGTYKYKQISCPRLAASRGKTQEEIGYLDGQHYVHCTENYPNKL